MNELNRILKLNPFSLFDIELISISLFYSDQSDVSSNKIKVIKDTYPKKIVVILPEGVDKHDFVNLSSKAMWSHIIPDLYDKVFNTSAIDRWSENIELFLEHQYKFGEEYTDSRLALDLLLSNVYSDNNNNLKPTVLTKFNNWLNKKENSEIAHVKQQAEIVSEKNTIFNTEANLFNEMEMGEVRAYFNNRFATRTITRENIEIIKPLLAAKQVNEFIECAFNGRVLPEKLSFIGFDPRKRGTKSDIYDIFISFQSVSENKNLSFDPSSSKKLQNKDYVELLTNYFKDFEFSPVINNWSKRKG